MKRIFITFMFALCAIVPLFADGFSGSGSGTESDPYRIFNADQLNQVRNFLGQTDVYFSLEADIDLALWLAENNPYEGWQPIGTNSSPFQGVFNGNGHTIFNLTIDRPSTDYVGLFGSCRDASIKNIILSNCSITGRNYVGSISGKTYEESSESSSSQISINGCESYGKIIGNDYVGGVAGFIDSNCSSGGLYRCLVRAEIIGTNYVGGIVGYS